MTNLYKKAPNTPGSRPSSRPPSNPPSAPGTPLRVDTTTADIDTPLFAIDRHGTKKSTGHSSGAPSPALKTQHRSEQIADYKSGTQSPAHERTTSEYKSGKHKKKMSDNVKNFEQDIEKSEIDSAVECESGTQTPVTHLDESKVSTVKVSLPHFLASGTEDKHATPVSYWY